MHFFSNFVSHKFTMRTCNEVLTGNQTYPKMLKVKQKMWQLLSKSFYAVLSHLTKIKEGWIHIDPTS